MEKEITGKQMLITPEMAAEWLKNKAPNREIKQRIVDQYCAEIRSGNWKITHQGIAFDENGMLSDGQHRLEGVVAAGTPVVMFVSYNVPRDAPIDSGSTRTQADNFTIQTGMKITDQHVAIATKMLSLTANRKDKINSSRVLECILKYKDSIDFVIRLKNKYRHVGLSDATISSVIARAYYYEDPDMLSSFWKALQTNTFESMDERVAILLRNTIQSRLKSKTKISIYDKYALTESAINSFCRKSGIKTIKPAVKELYPLLTKIG